MGEIQYKYLTTREEAEQAYKLSSLKDNSYWLGRPVLPPYLIDSAKKLGVIVAKDEEKVVGFIRFSRKKKESICNILEICVHPDYRGNRIAWTLCKKLPPPIESKVRPENEKIQSLYRKLGMRLWKKEHYVKKSGKEVNVLVYKTE